MPDPSPRKPAPPPQEASSGLAGKLGLKAVSSDRVQIEFQIEELVKILLEDKIKGQLSCAGCGGCN